MLTGTVTNSYLDGCYVGFSARRSSGATFDGSLNTWTISNSLVRLQAMPTVYSGSAAGHGGFFKWDDASPVSPKLNISNTIFRADQTTNHQDLDLPDGYDVTCSNNTMVWLGAGAYPGTLPGVLHRHHRPLGVGRGGPSLGHRASGRDHRARGIGR